MWSSVSRLRERDDRTPGTALVHRDADSPLGGDGDVPRGDDAVDSVGREHDVPETVSILEGDGTLPDATVCQDRDPDGAGGVGSVDPRHDRRAAGSDNDMRGPNRR